MTRKPEIPRITKDKIDKVLSLSGQAYQAQDIKLSLKLALEAWDIIPVPREQWDYYPQSLSSGFVEDYVDLESVFEAKKWIATTYKMYDDPKHEDHFVLMLEGSSLYKLGLFGESYEVFERIFNLFGRSGFAGEQLEYLEFYLKEREKKEK